MSDQGFKAGEKVVVSNWRGFGGGSEIRKVEKVSPTGIVTVRWYGRDLTFRSDGSGRGKSDCYEIRRPTPADFEAIERASLIDTIRSATSDTWKLLPLEKLRQAAALAEEADKLRKAGET